MNEDVRTDVGWWLKWPVNADNREQSLNEDVYSSLTKKTVDVAQSAFTSTQNFSSIAQQFYQEILKQMSWFE